MTHLNNKRLKITHSSFHQIHLPSEWGPTPLRSKPRMFKGPPRKKLSLKISEKIVLTEHTNTAVYRLQVCAIAIQYSPIKIDVCTGKYIMQNTMVRGGGGIASWEIKIKIKS